MSSFINLRDYRIKSSQQPQTEYKFGEDSKRILDLSQAIHKDYNNFYLAKATISNQNPFFGSSKMENIMYKDSIENLNSFIELSKDFHILKPSLFNLRGTENTCNKIFSFLPPKYIDGGIQMIAKVFNYGNVSCIF